MNTSIKKSFGLIALAILTTFASCRKDEFDQPLPGGSDPQLQQTDTIITIRDLKAIYDTFQFKTINKDWVIVGVVNSDDKAGNFYKSVIIQDSTAAIPIRIDVSDYYTKFPVGRKVYVKCKGLKIGDYGGSIQLGGSVDSSGSFPSVEPIASSLVSQYVLAGSYYYPVPVKTVSIADLTLSSNQLAWQNMLVRLDGVEFDATQIDQPFSIATSSTNRTLLDCNGDELIVRTSNYATFANAPIPCNNGSITGVFSVFNGDAQLTIRDLNDLELINPNRCDGVSCTPCPDPLATASIASIRALYSGTNTAAPACTKITGIVISDSSNKNIDYRNIIIQDATAGICVRFLTAHNFKLNDSVEVDISGQQLSAFAGQLQVNNVDLSRVTLIKQNATIVPRVATVADINANFSLWESTLVKVVGATITSTSGNYATSGVTVTDASAANILLYTRSAAAFIGTPVPAGTVNVTAIIVPYNTTKQLMLRRTSDVTP